MLYCTTLQPKHHLLIYFVLVWLKSEIFGGMEEEGGGQAMTTTLQHISQDCYVLDRPAPSLSERERDKLKIPYDAIEEESQRQGTESRQRSRQSEGSGDQPAGGGP